MIPAVLERCAGIDVGKKFMIVCLMIGAADEEPRVDVQRFETTNAELERLRDWLVSNRCAHVVMESTGSYWKPIFNILEANVTVVLANPLQVKNLPGHKTDRRDGKRLAHLLRHGLIQASFIPPKPIRELRDLTRRRRQLLGAGASERNRIQKVLEDANVKLASVLTDLFGVSGQAMLEALLEGKLSPEAIAEFARGRLKRKVPAIIEALQGHQMSDHHRFLIRQALRHMEFLEKQVEDLDTEILLRLQPYQDQFQQLQTIPGIKRDAAASILAEIGPDMSPFPSAGNLSSWAGVCPGNNESAGKHKSGHTRKGNVWLRSTLMECAWAASNKKDSYFKAKFCRLTARRGNKRAVFAIAHALLVAAYQVLQSGLPYRELGPLYLDEKKRTQLIKHYRRKLRELGTVAPETPTHSCSARQPA
jgi:transposase